MSGKIIDLPGNPVTSAPETLPWATQGTVLPPNSSQQETGWQPYGVGPPPDYRLENYARLTQSVLNARANQAGLFLEYTYAQVTLVGATVGNNRRITVDGTNIDYADQAGDTLADIVAAFVTLINTDPAASMVAVASASGAPGVIDIVGLEAGNNFTVTVAVLAGAGTITLTTAPTICITRQPGDLAYAADFVLGSPVLDDDGSPGHDARVQFDKSKAAFYAGKATGGQWNDANRGNESVNLGVDNTASGANSVAIGAACTASGIAAVAMGTSTASAQNTVAIGNATATAIGAVALGGQGFTTADATASDTFAVGSGSAASAANAIALGTSTTASQTSAVAIGNNATASATTALAIHGTASAAGAISLHGTASSANSIAIGENVVSSTGQASIAIGYGGGAGELTATAIGALATGKGATSNTVTASGRGARAHGAPNGAVAGTLLASGTAADAMGELCTASGDYSSAYGLGAVATNRGERAYAGLCDITLLKSDKAKHQAGRIILQARTTNGTATRLCSNALDGTGTNWTPTNYRAMAVRIKIVAKDGAGKYAAWFGDGLIDKDAGTVSVYNSAGVFGPGGAAPTYHTGVGFNALNVAVTASGGDVVVTATGIAATVIRWTCEFDYAQAGEDP